MRRDITFIDLFAGIGGTRIGFERAGAKCVFGSEWDKYCQKTYLANFGEIPHGDITKIDAKDIPDFDISLNASNVILGFTISFIIGIVSGIVPSYSASKLDPVEAMRY